MASYEKRASGWSIRFRLNGKNMRLSGFKTKKDAAIAYADAVQKPEEPKAEEITFGVLAEKYLQYAETYIKPQSIYETKSRLKNHVLPKFAEMNVNDMTAVRLVEWQNDLVGKYSVKFVCAIRAALSAVLSYGNSFYDLPNNLSKVRMPKDNSVKKEMKIWTPEQYAVFREYCTDDLFRLAFDTLFYTGMRKGEALALRPEDIKDGCVYISKTLTRKAGAGWNISTAKTDGSVRRVSVPGWLFDRLSERKGAYVLSRSETEPMAANSLEFAFSEYTLESGLPKIRIHDLRHSHASYLLSRGCSIVAVSRRLGHSSTRKTLDTYAHIMPSDENSILKAIEEA